MLRRIFEFAASLDSQRVSMRIDLRISLYRPCQGCFSYLGERRSRVSRWGGKIRDLDFIDRQPCR